MIQIYRNIFNDHRWLLLGLAFFFFMGLQRLNDLSLYTDSSRYVIWGTSFGHLNGFIDETQPEPSRYVVNAPFYAVILSPVLAAFPLSLVAAKVWTLLIGTGVLLLFHLFLRRIFSSRTALLGVGILAFNPLLLVISTEALSETSFLALTLIVLLLVERLEEQGRYAGVKAFILATILSLLPLLREIGFALVLAVLFFLLFKKAWKLALWITCGCLICFGVWTLVNQVLIDIPADAQQPNTRFITGRFVTSQASPMALEMYIRFIAGLKQTSVHLAGMLFYPVPDVLIDSPTELFRNYYSVLHYAQSLVPILFIPLAIIGIWTDLRERTTGPVRFIFILLYLGIVMVYPVLDIRFLLPVFPFMLFYGITGLERVARRWLQGRSGPPWIITSLAVVGILLPNALTVHEILDTNRRYVSSPEQFYDSLTRSGSHKPLFTYPWAKMGEWLRAHTSEEAVIAAPFKEISTFIGRRKLLELNHAVPTPVFERYLRDQAVEYLLSSLEQDHGSSYEFQLEESRRFQFVPITRISGLTLFEVKQTFFLSPGERAARETGETAIDALSEHRFHKQGRAALLYERYDEAIENLLKAGSRVPMNASLTSDLTIAHAMNGSLAAARLNLQALFSLPQSTAFLPFAQRHVDIALKVEQARAEPNTMRRSMVLLDAVSFYWSHGYSMKARSVLRELLQKDTTHLDALMKGWQLAIQLGDTTQAREYLAQARSIHPIQGMVKHFHHIDSLFVSLATTRSVRDRSRLHLEIARVYQVSHLPEEAMDEVERAIGSNPQNFEAWSRRGEMFSARNKDNAARKAYSMAATLEGASDRQ